MNSSPDPPGDEFLNYESERTNKYDHPVTRCQRRDGRIVSVLRRRDGYGGAPGGGLGLRYRPRCSQ